MTDTNLQRTMKLVRSLKISHLQNIRTEEEIFKKFCKVNVSLGSK